MRRNGPGGRRRGRRGRCGGRPSVLGGSRASFAARPRGLPRWLQRIASTAAKETLNRSTDAFPAVLLGLVVFAAVYALLAVPRLGRMLHDTGTSRAPPRWRPAVDRLLR